MNLRQNGIAYIGSPRKHKDIQQVSYILLAKREYILLGNEAQLVWMSLKEAGESQRI
jgi:hypothetical protein